MKNSDFDKQKITFSFLNEFFDTKLTFESVCITDDVFIYFFLYIYAWLCPLNFTSMGSKQKSFFPQCWAFPSALFYLLLQGYRRNAFSKKIGFFPVVVALLGFRKYRTFQKKFYVLKRAYAPAMDTNKTNINIKNSIFFQGFRYWHHWNLLMPWSHRIG